MPSFKNNLEFELATKAAHIGAGNNKINVQDI